MANPSTDWNPGFEHAALSDVGLRRTNNQDSMKVAPAGNAEQWHSRGHLFLVADGMGAHAAGELASEMAVDTISHEYLKRLSEPPPAAIRTAFQQANVRIYERGQDNLEFRGMGTTASALLLLPEGALVAHVGDSRVYRLRDKSLEQLSFDHSLVWELMHSGELHREEIPKFVPKNIITRSLGPNAEVQVDLEGPFPVLEGDTFVLCSDGLSGPLSDEEIGAMTATLPPDEAARALVDLANLRGGPDNITVIVVRALRATEGNHRTGPVPHRNSPEQNAAAPSLPILFAWALALVALLLGGLLAVAGVWIATLLAVGFAAISGVIALILTLTTESDSAPNVDSDARFGKGPYRQYSAEPSEQLVQGLAQTVHELREAGNEEQWDVDWERFGQFEHQAALAVQNVRYDEAVRQYAHAISFMMLEVREQTKKKPTAESSRDADGDRSH